MRIIEVNRSAKNHADHTATIKLSYDEAVVLSNAFYEYAQNKKLDKKNQRIRRDFYVLSELLQCGAIDNFALEQLSEMEKEIHK